MDLPDQHSGLSLSCALMATVGGLVNGITADLGTPHDPPKRTGIMDGQMLGATVVPKGDGSVRPAKATRELGPMPIFQQIVQKRLALRLGPTFEVDRVGTVDQ